jgi:transcriptional regulator with XRE-family HTH domain
MTPTELREARHTLRLSQQQLGILLGYISDQARGQISNMEAGRRTIRSAQRRLVEAYLAGYRPDDWPT